MLDIPTAPEDPRIYVLIIIGCVLMIATTFMHALGMYASLKFLKLLKVEQWAERSQATRAFAISLLIIFMFLIGILEAALWASTYVYVGALDNFRDSLYFSIVTYTTLGYGDIVLDQGWRLLASFEATNGIIMFGWTTAIIVATVHRFYLHNEPE